MTWERRHDESHADTAADAQITASYQPACIVLQQMLRSQAATLYECRRVSLVYTKQLSTEAIKSSLQADNDSRWTAGATAVQTPQAEIQTFRTSHHSMASGSQQNWRKSCCTSVPGWNTSCHGISNASASGAHCGMSLVITVCSLAKSTLLPSALRCRPSLKSAGQSCLSLNAAYVSTRYTRSLEATCSCQASLQGLLSLVKGIMQAA
jgi:hypothetical protein